MDFVLLVSLSAAGIFCGIPLFLKAGRQLCIRRMAQDPEGSGAGTNAIELNLSIINALIRSFI